MGDRLAAMQQLVLHPDCAPGPITTVSASVAPTASGCRARFRFEGDIARIRVPAKAPARRTDFLWKTTCCEIFWQPAGGPGYREFNLSPSGRWACYDFDDVRLKRRDGAVEAIVLAGSSGPAELVVEADIAADLPLPAAVALTAVVEDEAGDIQYWALAFPPGKPEFHSDAGRTVRLEAGQ